VRDELKRREYLIHFFIASRNSFRCELSHALGHLRNKFFHLFMGNALKAEERFQAFHDDVKSVFDSPSSKPLADDQSRFEFRRIPPLPNTSLRGSIVLRDVDRIILTLALVEIDDLHSCLLVCKAWYYF
jgi:hypothetical protein